MVEKPAHWPSGLVPRELEHYMVDIGWGVFSALLSSEERFQRGPCSRFEHLVFEASSLVCGGRWGFLLCLCEG